MKSTPTGKKLQDNASFLHRTDFPHKVLSIKIDRQISITSWWQLNSDRQCRSPQLGSQNFMPLLLLNTNFVKQEIKIGQARVLNEGLPDRQLAVPTTTPCSTSYD